MHQYTAQTIDRSTIWSHYIYKRRHKVIIKLSTESNIIIKKTKRNKQNDASLHFQEKGNSSIIMAYICTNNHNIIRKKDMKDIYDHI